MSAAIHTLTPMLAVQDPRGLALRQVDYCRSVANKAAERRVQHYRLDALGHRLECRDARLWGLYEQDGSTPANLRRMHSLSGRELGRDSVDAGFACALFGEAGQMVWSEDGRGIRREPEYDAQLRPLALHEQGLCSERYIYAEATADHARINACGRPLRHDDTAGSLVFEGYALGGAISAVARRFCLATDWPDWPVPLDERDALLETEVARSHWQHGPLGDVLEQTDAAGNRQCFGMTVAGELREVHMQSGSGAEHAVLVETRYNAFGQREEEKLGNGLVIQRHYREEDGRLLRLASRRAEGEPLQDLHYGYDPVGNVVAVEDLAQPLRHFANQRIQPRCEYFHDSLYQLCEATGWEAGTVSRGAGVLLDPGAVSNYRQTYRYDAGGNLLELTHIGAQAHGRTLVADRHSNRCLPEAEDFAGSFDANGNLLRLQPGQDLLWNLRNELREVRPVVREGGVDDWERYVYDGAGQRVRKLASRQAANRTHNRETRYLPGLERHENSATGERLEVIVLQAGTCGVRILHWLDGRPDEVAQDQVRYALGDHLGSSSLELDGEAALISHEVFHPFGSTAWWAARNAIEAGYKTLRYSGKERDASGLYYYGARYYRADWQRWLNPDPAGAADGLNLYCMVGNGPVNRRDPDGRQGFDVMDDVESSLLAEGNRIIHSGLENFPPDMRVKISEAMQMAWEMADSASVALSGGRGQKRLERVMTSAFGADALEPGPALNHLKGKLSRKLERNGQFLRRMSENDGWRLLLVEYADPDRAASSLPSEVRSARMSLSTREVQLDTLDLAVTFFHEGLHAMDMEAGSEQSAGDVLDYWYAMPELADGGGTLSGMGSAMRRAFRRIARRGPDEAQMSRSTRRWYTRLIKARTDQLGLPEARDAAQRRRYFREQPLVRHKIGAHNADTLTGIGFAFHKPR